jgi:hypothetical protein
MRAAESSEEDDKSDGDSDTDDIPITKGALKQLLGEFIRKGSKRGRRKTRGRSERSNKIELEKEKEKDEKWQRMGFCVCVSPGLFD